MHTTGIRNAPIEDITVADKVAYTIYFMIYWRYVFRREYKAASHFEKTSPHVKCAIWQRDVT